MRKKPQNIQNKGKVYFQNRSFLPKSLSNLGLGYFIESLAFFFPPSFWLLYYVLSFLLSSPEEEKKINQSQELQFKAQCVKSGIYWFKSAYFWDSLWISFIQVAYPNTVGYISWHGHICQYSCLYNNMMLLYSTIAGYTAWHGCIHLHLSWLLEHAHI